jgi:16S rRNA (guanine(527)-N(7))-methyltransferase RsmG
LIELFEKYKASLPPVTTEEVSLYNRHFLILKNWNERMALVSKKSIELSFANHFADSLFISDFAKKFLRGGRVYDLGTGAGFPGIIFGARYPEIKVRLYEKLLKKQTFLAAVINELNLKNIELQGAMPEERHEGVLLARAVMPPAELFPFVAKRLKAGAVIIVNIGSSTDVPLAPKEFKLLEEIRYSLPLDCGDRKAVAFEFVPRETK